MFCRGLNTSLFCLLFYFTYGRRWTYTDFDLIVVMQTVFSYLYFKRLFSFIFCTVFPNTERSYENIYLEVYDGMWKITI